MSITAKISNAIRGANLGWSTTSALSGKDFFCFTGNKETAPFFIDLLSFDRITRAYNVCFPLSAVIDRGALAMMNGHWWITDTKDNDIRAKYQHIYDLLAKPNPLQSQTEFLIQLDIYRQLYGEAFVLAIHPEGFGIEDTTALWVLNPNNVTINATGNLYMQSKEEGIIASYSLFTENGVVTIPRGDIIHIKDLHQNTNFSANDLRGKSRIIGLEKPINGLITAYDAKHSILSDRGAMGILSDQSGDYGAPLSSEEKTQLQEAYRRYGVGTGKDKVILTKANLKWQSMTLDVGALKIYEGIDDDIRRICERFNYPYELLSSENITYANKSEAKAQYYQDIIIPQSKIYAERLTSFFGLTNGDHIIIDFSEVEALKKSEKEHAQTMLSLNSAYERAYKNKVVTKEEWRLAMGLDEEATGGTFYEGEEKQTNNSSNGNESNT